MTKVIDLYNYLEDSIPTELSCTWDNDGLMCCPDNQREVKKVLFTLDITEKAVDYAIAEGFDVIVSHHPLIFHPLKSLSRETALGRTIMKLVNSEITALSYHTRLDSLSGGVNDALAEKVGIADPQPLTEKGEGRIGYIDEGGISASEFALFVKKRLSADNVSYVDAGIPVNKVAIVGGSGKDFIKYAIDAGADTFISGEIGYSYLTSYIGGKINLIEEGHFYTENPVLDKLVLMISGFDSEIYTEKYHSNEIGTV